MNTTLITKITKNKTVARVIAVLITALLFAASAPMLAAYAADNPLKITVKQTVVTSSDSAEVTFNYRLKPLEQDNPMPPGSTKEGYTFRVGGNSIAEIGPLRYSIPGAYRYELFQVIGTKKQGYIYDQRVYAIEAYVDKALNVTLVVKNTNGTKAYNIEFENGYNALPSDPKLMADPPVIKYSLGDGKPDTDSKPKTDGKPDANDKSDTNTNYKPNTSGKPGPASPKTGDELKTVFYFILAVLGGTAAIGAAVYLIACGTRKNGDYHENT